MKNKIVEFKDYALIELSNSKETKIDLDDIQRLKPFKWSCINKGYAITRFYNHKKRETWMLHRIVMDAPKGLEVDHINGDRLDNRKINLRLATKQQNAANQGKSSNKSSSSFKGVYPHGKKFRAVVKYNSKQIYLGLFATEHDAAEAYNKKALALFGSFARLNVLDTSK